MKRGFAGTLALMALGSNTVAMAMDPPGYTAPFGETLETINFPLLAMLRIAPGWAIALRLDPALQTMAAERNARIAAASPCLPRPSCLANTWIWTQNEISLVDTALRRIASAKGMTAALVGRHMRPSRRFGAHAALDDGAMLSAAWRDTAAAMNRVINVYAKGEPPRYPQSDAIIFDTARPEFSGVLDAHSKAISAMARPDDLIFDGPLRYTVNLLRMNERSDASAFRPLLSGENRATVAKIRKFGWRERRYSAILVFGHGPDDPQSRTGAMGYIRMAMAAELFARGVAPFIIVSGGNVHPNRTSFNEAVEMKKVMIAQYAVPADRILIEPHARHTTTNQRNCARLLFAAGFPTDRPAVIVTDPMTAGYLGSDQLRQRNVAEMGVNPGRITPGKFPFSFDFQPDAVAFHVNATDPLDP